MVNFSQEWTLGTNRKFTNILLALEANKSLTKLQTLRHTTTLLNQFHRWYFFNMTHPLHSSIKVLLQVEKCEKSKFQNSSFPWYSPRDQNESTFSLYMFSETIDGWIFFIPTEFQELKYSKETFLEQSVFLHTAILLGYFWAVSQGSSLHIPIHHTFIRRHLPTQIFLNFVLIQHSGVCFS